MQSLACRNGLATEASDKIDTDQSRPKIGLVLSGGGARGFAHIGALRVLEQNNIPVDYIAGTSMGSIIGGLYALGMGPDEIENGVRKIDWDKVFSDFAYRKYRSYRRKQDDYEFFNIHRIGINRDGLQLSPGLIEGQQIELALDRLAYPGFLIHDFDHLRIPYRAVATDIETGEPVVIKSGNLARAMRASMSIPGALPPLIINGKKVVDGGIANNIPIDIVRKMGADIVIVVDVSEPLEHEENIKSSLDITAQLTTIMTRRIADKQLATLNDSDVLIVPGERDITSSDFNQYPALIDEGYRAAKQELPKLEKLSLSDTDYTHYLDNLPKVADRTPVIDYVRIINKTPLRDDVIRAKIHQQIGQPLNLPQLEQDISYIYGLDYAGSVVYDIEQNDGKQGLVIYVRDRQWADSYLEFGLSIATTFENISNTNVYAGYNKNNLNDLAGEIRAIAAIGSEPEFSVEYYQPTNIHLNRYLSIKPAFETEVIPIVLDEHIQSVQRKDSTSITLSVGQIFREDTRLSLGMTYTDGTYTSISGVDAVNPDFIKSYYHVKLFHDSLDNLGFPNRGFFSSVTYTNNRTAYGADLDYQQLKLAISGAASFDRYTVLARILAETSDVDKLPLNALFTNGGFFELSGTIPNELLSPHFGLVEAAFYRRLGNITFLPIYTGFSLEAGNAWHSTDEINGDNLRYAGSVFIGADSFMGPIYLAIGGTDRGERAIYLNISRTIMGND